MNNPLRNRIEAENAMRARQFFNNKQSSSIANGGSAAFGGMVPEDEEASTSGQQELQQQLEKQEEKSKCRHQEAHDGGVGVRRQDLADGFRFIQLLGETVNEATESRLGGGEEIDHFQRF